MGGGGGLRSTICGNLLQFFNYDSIQKFHFSPEENSFPPFVVTTCSHLSCMSFVWQDAFLFLCSQNVVHFWGQ